MTATITLKPEGDDVRWRVEVPGLPAPSSTAPTRDLALGVAAEMARTLGADDLAVTDATALREKGPR